ncbi:copper homeostasis protein CutC [Vibrio sp.]|uniref:copper homeostasis protein CutC n=1 Tax=Vibrio sp. TaxID=678 RepID=UPI003D139FBA
MNHINVEVCIDNIESLHTAIEAGADRIELCSSLALGGITPTIGLTRWAINRNIPIYAMIRPRAGDFLFSKDEIALINDEIQFFRATGVDGIVIGALTERGEIDQHAISQWVNSAGGLGITFHRAFDLVADPKRALEQVIDLGCERVLTSGLAANAVEGITTIRQLVNQAGNRISIMPGCGVNQTNAQQIIDMTGATEIHLSGKKQRPSKMHQTDSAAAMGSHADKDSVIEVTDFQIIHQVVKQLNDH